MKILEKNEEIWQTERHIHTIIINFSSYDRFRETHLVSY